MTNTTEILDDLEYAAQAADSKTPTALRPLLRPGHVNVNWVERLHAIRDLENALATDTKLTFSNGTRSVPPRETGTLQIDGKLINTVTATNPFYGNALLGFHPDELTAAGIQQGEPFEITAHNSSWKVHYGQSYGDVPEGEQVAFPTAGDRILLVRNHESAIATDNLKVGDEISITIHQPFANVTWKQCNEDVTACISSIAKLDTVLRFAP